MDGADDESGSNGAAGLRRIISEYSGRQLSVQEMVGAYFEAMSASAYAAALRESGSMGAEITETERAVSEFNQTIHRKMLAQLDESIGRITDELKNASDQSSGAEADRYEELRSMMSAREFVGQYDRGLQT